MRKKQLTLFAGVLMLGVAFFATSCSNNDIPEVTSDWVSISVKATDWEWVEENYFEENNLVEGYYIAIKSVPQLTNYIYNNGVITAYTAFDDGTMTALPFLKTYGYGPADDRGYYTEYISFDFYVGEIVFVLEVSDLQRADDYLIDRVFEVRMAW